MSRLDGRLIDGKAAYSWLIGRVDKTPGEVSICSAFIRSKVLRDFSHKVSSETSVRVMARWKLRDLTAGASDLESYKVCASLGWKFFIRLDFHGKLFYLPSHGILVGSANATESGLGLLSDANMETCTIVPENSSNQLFVDELYKDATEMDEQLFVELESIYNESVNKLDLIDWPNCILQKVHRKKAQVQALFLTECFKSDGSAILRQADYLPSEAESDLRLLGLFEDRFDKVILASRFQQSKIYLLLLDLLRKRGGEVYFGSLTQALHDWLIEDPAPHRVEVKILVKNLYGWIERLGPEHVGVLVDRPNHSQRIRLTESFD